MILPRLDDLTIMAATVYMEARGEPFIGKCAVAHVIMNRTRENLGPIDVVLAPWQFSCWNTDSPTRRFLDFMNTTGEWEECVAAAAHALFRRWYFDQHTPLADPSGGAIFYLNVELTKSLRGGTLPKWAAHPDDNTRINADKVTTVVGRHTFMKA